MSSGAGTDIPRPRLCHVRKWEDFNGYGFNLHAEKGKVGQYIGKIDPGSPAEGAGLKEHDRIVEVNGTNISNENHQQVVQRIKAVPNETKILVVDAEADEYYKSKHVVLRGDMPDVDHRDSGSRRGESTSSAASAPTPAAPVTDDATTQRARLCVMRISPDFQGYGFNLHAEKNKPGQFIGKVDPGSPAEKGGLKENDRIIEVNDVSLADDTHAKVVERIKSNPRMVRMLVVDKAADNYFKENNIAIRGDMPNVDLIDPEETPKEPPAETAVAAVEAHAAAEDEEPEIEPQTAVPSPRHCHVKKWDNFTGYGFNLHAEKGKAGHFIGNVDADSPAMLAGLQKGDKIVEVNGSNVLDDTHSDTVVKIKENSSWVKMLVVDTETEDYYSSKSIVITSYLPAVKFIECPDSDPSLETANHVEDEAPAESVETVAVVAAVSTTPEPTTPEPSTPEPAVDPNAPKPRYCHVKKWPTFAGYGFNLHAEKGKAGHYIGVVDPKSPADYAGLKQGDKIIEVNGESIREDNHAATVSKIKANPNAVRLLVVDQDTEEYYKNQDVLVTGELDNVEHIECPDSPPSEGQVNGNSSSVEATSVQAKPEPTPVAAPTPTPVAEPISNSRPDSFGKSAAEMRAALSRKKKSDPRQSSMSLREKYAVYQNL